MINQIESIWKQTRDLPPAQQAIVNTLFSEIEHLHSAHKDNSAQPGQLELFHQSKYYEPRWFSTYGHIQ